MNSATDSRRKDSGIKINFRRDIGAHFDFELGPVHVTKSIYLAPDSDTVAIEYDFTSVGDGITFMLRPFAAMRNFHHLQKSPAPLYISSIDGAVTLALARYS